MANLAEGLVVKLNYVRKEVLPAYQDLGAAGQPVIQLVIDPAIDEGIEALASGDVIRIMRAYSNLDDVKL